MTRDEILNMPAGKEMDALVAENVMGWMFGDYVAHGRTRKLWMSPDMETRTIDPKPYSTDISAAFKLTEKAAYFELRLGDVDLGYEKWYCEFATEESHAWGAEADTASLAISRAALLTTMDKK